MAPSGWAECDGGSNVTLVGRGVKDRSIPAADPIAALEADLFETLLGDGKATAAAPVFILGAPRTGSTIFYQSLVSAFSLPFFDNLTNDRVPENPIIGLWLQAGHPGREGIASTSRYGKVTGTWQPSEASGVMTGWFGGGHPSELVSDGILPGRERHFLSTMAAAHGLFGRPLAIKNAWNCFRIGYLSAALPESSFIWIRRDIAAAAKSDLSARLAVQGDPRAWNSATPRNIGELRALPPWRQVVENQAEFSRAIAGAGSRLGTKRFVEVWYEDFCADQLGALTRLGRECSSLHGMEPDFSRIPGVDESPRTDSGQSGEDAALIEGFVAGNPDRFSHLRHIGGQRGNAGRGHAENGEP